MLDFSQAVAATIKTVTEQAHGRGLSEPTVTMMRAAAKKHVGSSKASLVDPVIAEAQREMDYDALVASVE